MAYFPGRFMKPRSRASGEASGEMRSCGALTSGGRKEIPEQGTSKTHKRTGCHSDNGWRRQKGCWNRYRRYSEQLGAILWHTAWRVASNCRIAKLPGLENFILVKTYCKAQVFQFPNAISKMQRSFKCFVFWNMYNRCTRASHMSDTLARPPNAMLPLLGEAELVRCPP